MHLKAFFLTLLLISPGLLLADSFRADFRTIVHADAKADSTGLGYLEVGEFVEILPDKEQLGWIKIKGSKLEGWIYKKRGKVVKGALPDDMHFWFGNLHAHTSEGSSERNVARSTYKDAFDYATDNEAGNLDFLAITPHYHLVKRDSYRRLLDTVNHRQFYKKNRFVPIAGQEFGSAASGNHLTVFELFRLINPNSIPSGDFRTLFEKAIPQYQTESTFAQFNHPQSPDFSYLGTEYGRDDYQSDYDRWIAATDSIVQLIEIVKSPSFSDATDSPHYEVSVDGVNAWLWALNKGWHLAPVANQANHQYNWGDASDSRTVAISEELSRKSLLTAFQNRRCYASEDSTLRVTFKAGGLWMGEQIRQGDFSGFVVSANDLQEPDAVYLFELYRGQVGGSPLTLDSEAYIERPGILNNSEVLFDQIEVKAGEFYFVKVTQSNTPDDPNQNAEGDNAWTAPIWIIEDDH